MSLFQPPAIPASAWRSVILYVQFGVTNDLFCSTAVWNIVDFHIGWILEFDAFDLYFQMNAMTVTVYVGACSCFDLLRRRIQICDCPCQSVTRAAAHYSPLPKITRMSSCPRTCSCQGRIKVLHLPNPPSPDGGTSPTQSELNLRITPLVVGKMWAC